MCCLVFIFFFFQAEDGIRDVAVTGVQTCALPIYHFEITDLDPAALTGATVNWTHGNAIDIDRDGNLIVSFRSLDEITKIRSEERRVGKECRSRWSPYH